MPNQVERDEYTGTETTGHEWDGITELDTPLPKWWLYVLLATILWSLVYVVLYPAIPGLSGYTKGVLGYSQRVELEKKISDAALAKAPMFDRIARASFSDILATPELFGFASAGGRTAYADNCVPCHGAGGGGARGYPNLADDAWLWGGGFEQIYDTVRYGVRSGHDDTRESEMPRFGADGTLKSEQIDAVAEFVLTLSGGRADAAAAKQGGVLYTEHCAACHGEDGAGNAELGAPRLSDPIWLYGGEKSDIVGQIKDAKHGSMPAWITRLDEITIKMLTVYVHALGGGK